MLSNTIRILVIFALTLSFYFIASTNSYLLANDTEAEISLGGIHLLKSSTVSIEKEELFISKNKIHVKYHYVNHSVAPVEATIAFPLPDINNEDSLSQSQYEDATDLNFKTLVDGKEITLKSNETVEIQGKNINSLLIKYNIPLNPFSPTLDRAIKSLSEQIRKQLAAEGIIEEYTTSQGVSIWEGKWSLKTIMLRKQIFPPNKLVIVEHEYRPHIGGSLITSVTEAHRSLFPDSLKSLRSKYCIEDNWINALDSKLSRMHNPELSNISLSWIGYILKTGANWSKPIKEFHAIVEKEKPQSLVSFCAKDVKKISPKRFEFKYNNFVPTDDLNIIMID